MKFYFQYRYDTEADASCGTVYCFEAFYLAGASSQARARVREKGFRNAALVGVYDHEPNVDEIDNALANWKKNRSIHVDKSLEDLF